MANYTLRIELVGDPTEPVYKDLHERMKAGGFLQTVRGVDSKGNSVVVKLPHATYFGSTTADAKEVREWAVAHAKEVWGKSVIFVAETSDWASS
jgi:hypothetical protein